MTSITKAAQDALAALDEIHTGKRHPQLALAVAQQVRSALQDKAGEVTVAIDHLHNERRDGMTDRIWPPVKIGTRLFAAQPAPVVPDDVARDAARYRLIRDGSGWPAAFAAHDAPEPLRGDDLDAAMIAASQKKGGQ